jgi:hypothetical protein
MITDLNKAYLFELSWTLLLQQYLLFTFWMLSCHQSYDAMLKS